MTRNQRRYIRPAMALAVIVLLTAGCGQKGDLFLPDKTAARYTSVPAE